MVPRRAGKIVNVASLNSFIGGETVASYAASKGGVSQLTKALSNEWAKHNVQVNAIAPGPMDTRTSTPPLGKLREELKLMYGIAAFFYPQESPEAVAFHKSNALGNRLTKTEDIAPMIRFLVTEGGWITGQTLFANGGYTTR